MKFISFIIVFSFTLSLNAQGKYFIYFKDKEFPKGQVLLKSSTQFVEAENLLSKRSIERRKKTMGENNYITYEDIPVSENYVTEVENLGIKIIRKLKWFNAVTANLSTAQLEQLNNLSFVKKIEPVRVLKYKRLDETENKLPAINKSDQTENNIYSYGNSFGQAQFSNVPDVHNLGITGANIRIGIMDSGFEWQNHPALSGANVIAEYDFVNNDGVTSNQAGDVSTQHNHGTNVLSVIAGYLPDTLIGLAFNSEFVLAKTEDIPTETHLEEDNYAAALQWFDSLGVDVTNSSVGYNIFDAGQYSYSYNDMNGTTSIVTQAENLAFTRGIVTVTSAGNEGNNSWYYITAPADAFNTISVGAALPSRSLTNYSSHGPTSDGRTKPEIVNQGSSVFVANPFSGYRLQNGTSFSSPLTAGIVSLLISAHPHLKNTQVRRIILESGDRSENPDNDYGWGLVSASKAIGFPNLSESNGQYTLHKIFVSTNGVNSETAKVNYQINNGDFQTDDLTATSNHKFTYELNGFSAGDTINFYFTYRDALNSSIREPETKNFKIIYGNLDVFFSVRGSTNISNIPEKYTLEQNYPNPFNPITKIVFFPLKEEFAELNVYDILGKHVKTLFRGIAKIKNEGEFTFWDGTNNSGLKVNSGIYFYSLNIGGTQLTKKMVYIK